MIKASDLINDFYEALSMKCPYVSPGNVAWKNIKNGVDCSGLFTAAFRRHGGDIDHGSNSIARKQLTSREKLTKVNQLTPGMAVFKWDDNGGEPEKYKKDGLGDYHHIGLVVSTSPIAIIHASSAAGEVTKDTSIKKWTHCGTLKGVTYDEAGGTIETEDEPVSTQWALPCIARIKTNGGKLNYRKEPNGRVLGQFPNGEDVFVDEIRDGWAYCTLDDEEGWCSMQYLYYLSEADGYYTDDDEEDGVSYYDPEDMNTLDSFDKIASEISDIEAVQDELISANAAKADQISAIFKALYKAGIMKTLPHYSNGALEV